MQRGCWKTARRPMYHYSFILYYFLSNITRSHQRRWFFKIPIKIFFFFQRTCGATAPMILTWLCHWLCMSSFLTKLKHSREFWSYTIENFCSVWLDLTTMLIMYFSWLIFFIIILPIIFSIFFLNNIIFHRYYYYYFLLFP
jgi:hypothetical protein